MGGKLEVASCANTLLANRFTCLVWRHVGMIRTTASWLLRPHGTSATFHDLCLGMLSSACVMPSRRYDPYNRKLTIETYDHAGMRAVRRRMIEAAATAQHWGVVLGTLGRQGNPRIVTNLQQHLAARGCSITTVLLSEVSPPKLAAIGHVDAWVQVACPRLSIDWGEGFVKPTLTPYEAMIALGLVPGWWQAAAAVDSSCSGSAAAAAAGSVSAPGMEPYPMDYYAKDGGVWNSSYHKGQPGGSGSASRGPRAARRAATVAVQ